MTMENLNILSIGWFSASDVRGAVQCDECSRAVKVFEIMITKAVRGARGTRTHNKVVKKCVTEWCEDAMRTLTDRFTDTHCLHISK